MPLYRPGSRPGRPPLPPLRQRLQRSPDRQCRVHGLRFEPEPGVRIAREKAFESHEVYAPEVLLLGTGGYRMYYAGWVSAPEVPAGSKYHGRIFSAFSEDGLQWLKDPDICLDNGGRWDTVKASEPCIIDLADGRHRMFYEACDHEGRWRIASATAAGGES